MLIAALLGFVVGMVTMAVIWYITNYRLTIKALQEFSKNHVEARRKAEEFVNSC